MEFDFRWEGQCACSCLLHRLSFSIPATKISLEDGFSHIFSNVFSLITSAEDTFVPLVFLSVKWEKELYLLYRVEELVELICENCIEWCWYIVSVI